MKKDTTYEAISNHRKGIYYRKMSKEMLESGYMIEDSKMTVGGKNVGYEKLIELLNTAKEKGIEKIVMTSIEHLTGTQRELEKVVEAFEKCEVPIVTKDGTYENGKFIPNFLAVSETDMQTDDAIIDRETWEKVQEKLSDSSKEQQEEGFAQTLL